MGRGATSSYVIGVAFIPASVQGNTFVMRSLSAQVATEYHLLYLANLAKLS